MRADFGPPRDLQAKSQQDETHAPITCCHQTNSTSNTTSTPNTQPKHKLGLVLFVFQGLSCSASPMTPRNRGQPARERDTQNTAQNHASKKARAQLHCCSRLFPCRQLRCHPGKKERQARVLKSRALRPWSWSGSYWRCHHQKFSTVSHFRARDCPSPPASGGGGETYP